MRPLVCKINPDRSYFYCLIVVGHLLPDRPELETLDKVFGLWWAAHMTPRRAVNGIWRRPDDRSIIRAVVEIAQNTDYRPARLPESGSQIRKNRPDLNQYFPDDFRGEIETTIGDHILQFVVGWPTHQAAREALLQLQGMDLVEALEGQSPPKPTPSNNIFSGGIPDQDPDFLP